MGFEDLARYNADCARGVMFTAEAKAHYAEQQAEFNRRQDEAYETAGWRKQGQGYIWP